MDNESVLGFALSVGIDNGIYRELLIANGLPLERAVTLKIALQDGIPKTRRGAIALSGYDAKRHVLHVFPDAAFYLVEESPMVLGTTQFQKLMQEKLLDTLAHEGKHVIQSSRRSWRILMLFEKLVLPPGLMLLFLGLYLGSWGPGIYRLLRRILGGLELTPMVVLVLATGVYVALRLAEKLTSFLWEMANRLAYTLAPSEIQARRFAQRVLREDPRWGECVTISVISVSQKVGDRGLGLGEILRG